MHKLIIIFAGLIAHVGLDTPTHQRAVMIKVPNPKHRAILIVKKTDVDASTPTSGRAAFKQISGGPTTETWFSLEGEHVRVVGVPLGATTPTAAFSNAAVHLKDITKDTTGHTRTLDSKILNGDLSHGSASSFVKYDGGTIDLKSTFKYEAKFDPPLVTQRCLACEVQWTSDETPSTYVDFVAESGKWARVKSDAVVVVSHLPVDPKDSKHFHMYKSILSNVAMMSDILTTATPCTTSVCPASRGVTLECTNSQWP